MTALMTAQTVYRFGRKHAQHSWSVHVVGDDARGYWCEVRTKCGLVVTGNDEAALIEGFVTCDDCSRPEGSGNPGVTGAQPDEPASQVGRPAHSDSHEGQNA